MDQQNGIPPTEIFHQIVDWCLKIPAVLDEHKEGTLVCAEGEGEQESNDIFAEGEVVNEGGDELNGECC